MHGGVLSKQSLGNVISKRFKLKVALSPAASINNSPPSNINVHLNYSPQ